MMPHTRRALVLKLRCARPACHDEDVTACVWLVTMPRLAPRAGGVFTGHPRRPLVLQAQVRSRPGLSRLKMSPSVELGPPHCPGRCGHRRRPLVL